MSSRPSAEPHPVDDYMEGVSPRLRPLLGLVRRTIRAAAPGAEEVISYRMPAIRQDGIVVYYAAFSDHCSLFVGSAHTRAKFAKELASFVGGKGTVRFTPDHPLPMGLLTRIVKARIAENAERRRSRGGAPRARHR